jgi:hypothetical protein
MRRADCALQIDIFRVLALKPREGKGFGYDIVVDNRANEDIFVLSIDLRGEVERDIMGAFSTEYRVVFAIELEAALPKSDQVEGTLEGVVYDEHNQQWGIQCNGELRYSLDTAHLGRQTWQYRLTVPCPLRLPGRNRTTVRLLFKRKARKLIEENGLPSNSGASLGRGHQKHSLVIRLESGQLLSTEIDSGILELVANWPD